MIWPARGARSRTRTEITWPKPSGLRRIDLSADIRFWVPAPVPGPIVVTNRNITKTRQTGLDGNAVQTAHTGARMVQPDELS